MSSENYFKERQYKYTIAIRNLLKELPDFCSEFFIGIENRTSVLTRLGYAYDLRIFFNYLYENEDDFFGYNRKSLKITDLNRVSATMIERFLNYLNLYESSDKFHSDSVTTKSRKLACLKSMFKYFYCKDKLDRDPAAKVQSPKIHEKAIVRLESNEVDALLKSIENEDCFDTAHQKGYFDKTKKRDIAIITLLLGTGIRVSELVGLNISDINFNENAFKVTRKGGNEMILYFSDEVAFALQSYIEERQADPELRDLTALFLSIQKKRIGVRAVEKLVKKYALNIVPLKKITPHKLRSTYGTELYRATQDIFVVAEVLGHKDINTTRKHYAEIGDDIRRSAANKVVLRKTDDDDTFIE